MLGTTNGGPSPTDIRLRNAIERLYRAFKAPAPSIIEGCPCCIEKRGVDVLLTTPLRELSAAALSQYVAGLFYTLGSERDFRYLMPRMIDLSSNESPSAIGPEVVLGKFGLANWRSWSEPERGAIEELIAAWFEKALAQDIADAVEDIFYWRAESVLCGAARAGLPLSPLLLRLQELDAALVLQDIQNRSPRHLSAFWKDAPDGLKQLSAIIAR